MKFTIIFIIVFLVSLLNYWLGFSQGILENISQAHAIVTTYKTISIIKEKADCEAKGGIFSVKVYYSSAEQENISEISCVKNTQVFDYKF